MELDFSLIRFKFKCYGTECCSVEFVPCKYYCTGTINITGASNTIPTILRLKIIIEYTWLIMCRRGYLSIPISVISYKYFFVCPNLYYTIYS